MASFIITGKTAAVRLNTITGIEVNGNFAELYTSDRHTYNVSLEEEMSVADVLNVITECNHTPGIYVDWKNAAERVKNKNGWAGTTKENIFVPFKAPDFSKTDVEKIS